MLNLGFILQCSQIFLILFVTVTLSETGKQYFYCKDGNKFDLMQFCDGVMNCDDNSDEAYGCDNKNHPGKFKCETGNDMVDVTFRCHKNQTECKDGSDEKHCSHEMKENDCLPKNGKFHCQYSGECIDIKLLCDGQDDCGDNADEGDYCNSRDPKCDADCKYPCTPFPEEHKCFCFKNESVEDSSLCQDFIEDNTNIHTEKCYKFKDYRYCICPRVYELAINGSNCVNPYSANNILLYVTNDTVKFTGFNENDPVNEINNGGLLGISSVAADGNFIYFATAGRIGRCSFDSECENEYITEGLGEVTEMNIDYITSNIYFIEKNHTGYRIIVCKQEYIFCANLYNEDFIDQPKKLALAPKSGFIFWGTVGKTNKPYIGRSDMNGKNIIELVTTHILSVDSMAVDEFSETLYWLDSQRRMVISISFQGTNRLLVFSDPRVELTVISVFENYLYGLTSENNSVYKIENQGMEIFHVEKKSRMINRFHMYNPKLLSNSDDDIMENPCLTEDESYCKHGICVLVSGNSADEPLKPGCICELETELEDGEIWCPNDKIVEPTTTEKISTENANTTFENWLADDESFWDTVMDAACLVLYWLILILFAVCLILFFIYMTKKMDFMER